MCYTYDIQQRKKLHKTVFRIEWVFRFIVAWSVRKGIFKLISTLNPNFFMFFIFFKKPSNNSSLHFKTIQTRNYFHIKLHTWYDLCKPLISIENFITMRGYPFRELYFLFEFNCAQKMWKLFILHWICDVNASMRI